jgi:hypothetical protein
MDFMSVIVGEALSLGEVLVPLLRSLIVIAQWEMTEFGLGAKEYRIGTTVVGCRIHYR